MVDIVRIAIVEEDEGIAKTIRMYCEKFFSIYEKKFEAVHFSNALDFVSDYKPVYDLVFMDTEFSNIDGISAARKLREIDEFVLIAFVAANGKYAVEGYEVSACDYLLKPLTYRKFLPRLTKAINYIVRTDEKRIIFQSEGILRVLYVRDVCYVEVRGHNVTFHTATRQITTRARMYDVEKALESYGFFRVYDCYLVNLRHVNSLSGYTVTVNGDELTVSRSRKKSLSDALKAMSSAIK